MLALHECRWCTVLSVGPKKRAKKKKQRWGAHERPIQRIFLERITGWGSEALEAPLARVPEHLTGIQKACKICLHIP